MTIATNFDTLVGNSKVKTYLKRMLTNQTIGNSLLFAGPDGVGKSLFAYALASQLILKKDPEGPQKHKLEAGCHPDIHIYRPEGKLGIHSVQTLHQFTEEVQMPPYEAPWKAFIVHEADRMLSYSSNALLKTFEEPPKNTLIILLSSAPFSILPTILSRCRTIHFQPLTNHEIESALTTRCQLDSNSLQSTIHLAQGSLAHALQVAEHKGESNRDLLFKVLSNGSFSTYKELSSAAQHLAAQVDASNKRVEELAKIEMHKAPQENLTSHQHHSLEKELEGLITMNAVNEAKSILEMVLSWYRDLHLLQLQGNLLYLQNLDYKESLQGVLESGKILSLDKVQKIIQEAYLSLQRSTSLNICLENLFLKLDLI